MAELSRRNFPPHGTAQGQTFQGKAASPISVLQLEEQTGGRSGRFPGSDPRTSPDNFHGVFLDVDMAEMDELIPVCHRLKFAQKKLVA